MDDELKAIQDDLNSVLERLVGHLEGASEQEEQDERLANLLYYFALNREEWRENTLEIALAQDDGREDAEKRRQLNFQAEHGEHKGSLMAALETISIKHKVKSAVPRWALETLSDPVGRYIRNVDRYLGEYGSEDLLRHRGRGVVKPRGDDMERALLMVLNRCKDDPKHNKLSRKSVHSVYEQVARDTHLGEVDIERNWLPSPYPSVLRRYREMEKAGTNNGDTVLEVFWDYLYSPK